MATAASSRKSPLTVLFGTRRRRRLVIVVAVAACVGVVLLLEWHTMCFWYYTSRLRKTEDWWTHSNPQCEDYDIGDGTDLECRWQLIELYSAHPRSVGPWLLGRLADPGEHVKVREVALDAFEEPSYRWGRASAAWLQEPEVVRRLSAICSQIRNNTQEPARIRDRTARILDGIARNHSGGL